MHGFSTPCLFPFLSASNAKEQPGGENDIQAFSITVWPSQEMSPPLPPITTVELRLGSGCAVEGQTLAGSSAVHMGEKCGWHPGAPCITWDVFVYTFICISGQ